MAGRRVLVDELKAICYDVAPAGFPAASRRQDTTVMRLFLPALFGALVLASVAQAETSLPRPETLLSAESPMVFTKWKAKHWKSRPYGWDRGYHYGWTRRPARTRTYYRVRYF